MDMFLRMAARRKAGVNRDRGDGMIAEAGYRKTEYQHQRSAALELEYKEQSPEATCGVVQLSSRTYTPGASFPTRTKSVGKELR